jgi:magnesium chelatase subunit D
VEARVVVDAAAYTTTGFAADVVAPTALPRVAAAPIDRAQHRRPAAQHLRGRSGPSSESADRGRITRTTPYDSSRGIAVAASLLRAVRRTAAERAAGVQDPAPLVRDDLRSARRRRRGGVHTVIIADGSSSLGRDGLLRAGSVTDQLVASAVARRGVVSVIVASGERSTVLSARSTSLHRTRDTLRRAPTGGGTPLSDGLLAALDLLDDNDRARRRIVVVTDGRPTVDLAGRGCDEHTASAELEQVLRRVAERVPDVAMLPVGVPPGKRFERDTAAFRAVGARIL